MPYGHIYSELVGVFRIVLDQRYSGGMLIGLVEFALAPHPGQKISLRKNRRTLRTSEFPNEVRSLLVFSLSLISVAAEQ
jgi:hypothetical protein